MKRSHLLTAAAGALATLAAPAHALTVGEARVLSFTDQPLRVLIPIKAQGWEWRALWASAQTYQRGLGLTATLYKPTGDKTEGVIEIRSKAPITEPIVDLQITFETGHRTTIHRTPILIDVQHASATVVETQAPMPQNPRAGIHVPTQAQTGSPAGFAPAPSVPAEQQVYPQNGPFPEVQAVISPPNEHVRASSYQPPPEFAPASARASQGIPMPPSMVPGMPAKSVAANQGTGPEQYTVKSGDGLYAIASRHKPALWSVEESMAHIFKHNRQAFAGGAYNTLKAGAVLTFGWNGAPQRTVPQAGTAFPEVRTSEAFGEPQAQRPVVATPTAKPFTEDDARAAVLRHRMVQIQQELNTLQKGRTQ